MISLQDQNFLLRAKKNLPKQTEGDDFKVAGKVFDAHNPQFFPKGLKVPPSAKQGHGKKTLGPTNVKSGNPGAAAEQGHGKRSVQGVLDRKEETEMTDKQVTEAGGDARGQGNTPDGKRTLGAVRIKPDSSPSAQGHGGPAVQGQGKKKLGADGEGHPGSPADQGYGGAAVQGHGKIPIRGEIRREDVQALIAAALDDKPSEALEKFDQSINPIIQGWVAGYKEHLQNELMGVESVVVEEDEELTEDDVDEELTAEFHEWLKTIDEDSIPDDATEQDVIDAFLEQREEEVDEELNDKE